MLPDKFSPKTNEILRTINDSTKPLYNTKLWEVCSLASHQQSQSTSAVSRGKGPLRHYLSSGGEQKARTGIRCGRQLQARRDPPMMVSAASVATGISQGKSQRCSSGELCGRTSRSLCARQFIRVCILASSLCRKDGV